jgi:hypothetical protein
LFCTLKATWANLALAATISAAPQIRDKAAEIKRLMPTSLLVRRNDPIKAGKAKYAHDPNAHDLILG